MAYYDKTEHAGRITRLQSILRAKDLDYALIYYDEFNVGNGWYLTGWCPQFESGAVLVPQTGEPMILGGPESEPFAKQDSAIKDTYNIPALMVPDEEYPNATISSFDAVFKAVSKSPVRRMGIVGGDSMPVSVYNQLKDSINGVTFVDITADFLALRVVKSDWEQAQIASAFKLCDAAYEAMAAAVAPGVPEYKVAAAGEAAARIGGASGFAFQTIVGSGMRSNAVVPTAMDKIMESGETVMLGIAPRIKGYAGVMGHTLPVNGTYTPLQAECIKHVKEVMRLTRAQLIPGKVATEIDKPGHDYFTRHDLMPYLVCPFVHTIGIMEAEAPFFGPGGTDVLVPGMTVCVDVSFFGHPQMHGVRIETGYLITETGAKPLSPYMENVLLG